MKRRRKILLYQMLPRLWGNSRGQNIKSGSLSENGTGHFGDVDDKALDYLKEMGFTHVWYMGVICHSTMASDFGCTPSHPQFVKGNAGSPFAIRDYYDVNPYLAENPQERMSEFEALIKRTHDHGLKVIMDFVPNHVARDYKSDCAGRGVRSLGEGDDTSVHWSPDNDFFYYPGQALRLPSTDKMSRILAENGMNPYVEYPAKASGNCFSPSPGINDWYETIRINWCDTHTETWDKMADILRFWASKGVDGFRCDMVEMVPPEACRWFISELKKEYKELIFIAEVYRTDLYSKYLKEVGFDLLYDKSGLYDTLRCIVEKNTGDNPGYPVSHKESATAITSCWQSLGELQGGMLNFLENHDEHRFGSEFFGRDVRRSFAALSASLFFNTASFMMYFGEEVGESGMYEEGFSGIDGRTSIFDWWRIDSLVRLRRCIASGDAEMPYLKSAEKAVFHRYRAAMKLAASSDAVMEGMTYDLCWCNENSRGFNKYRHFVFLRTYEQECLLFACNFSASRADFHIDIPEEAKEFLKLSETVPLSCEIVLPPFDACCLRLDCNSEKLF